MSSTGGGRSRRGTLRREQILDAAEELFGEAGYGATSLRALAKRVGVTHSGLLRHYASKDDLLLALLARTDTRTPPDPAHLDPVGDPRRAIERLAREAVTARPHVELAITLLGEAAASEHPARPHVERRLAEGARRLAPFGAYGPDFLAAWEGLQLLWLYLPERVSPADALATRLARYRSESDESGAERADWISDAEVTAGRKPADAPSLEREDEIIDAAARAFSRQGFHGTSLRTIAADLGLTHGTLLYYFPSKGALLEAVLNRRDRDADTAYITPVTVYDKAYNVYRRAVHNDAHPEWTALYSALVCEATHPDHPAHAYFAARFTRVLDKFAGELRSLQAQGLLRPGLDVEQEAAWFTALWDGLQIHQPYGADSRIPERLLRSLDGLLADGVPAETRTALLTQPS
ncbi:helix-turn-helix domain-containing protein [Streptomyces sp. NPDC048428]|uniref:TetR/AcrR family transcriptional regulator n=1 Tax=Streptomyces sp. NPDC048428 TaxID=3154503 RepID=UPI0034453EC7